MIRQCVVGRLLGFLILSGLLPNHGGAAEPSRSDPGPVERVEETAERVGKSIEESVRNTVKNVEDKHIPEKAQQRLKQLLDETAEGIEKVGKDIKKKFDR